MVLLAMGWALVCDQQSRLSPTDVPTDHSDLGSSQMALIYAELTPKVNQNGIPINLV